MMSIIIAVLISIGVISTPQQATDQVIDNNKEQLQEIIGDDLLDF